LTRQPKRLDDKERAAAKEKIENSCRRFDKRGKGKLTVEEFYNVIKLQNHVDTSKEDIRKLAEDLDVDRDGKINIKVEISQSSYSLLPVDILYITLLHPLYFSKRNAAHSLPTTSGVSIIAPFMGVL